MTPSLSPAPSGFSPSLSTPLSLHPVSSFLSSYLFSVPPLFLALSLCLLIRLFSLSLAHLLDLSLSLSISERKKNGNGPPGEYRAVCGCVCVLCPAVLLFVMKPSLCSHPEVDYFSITSCPWVFYSSYTTAVYQHLPLKDVILFIHF